MTGPSSRRTGAARPPLLPLAREVVVREAFADTTAYGSLPGR